jgi:hypothetical protein
MSSSTQNGIEPKNKATDSSTHPLRDKMKCLSIITRLAFVAAVAGTATAQAQDIKLGFNA